MDIMRTEGLIARLKRDGWDITPNAYKYAFPGTYVMAGTEKGTVLVSKGAAQINLDTARRLAAHLEKIPGITDVVMGSQMRNGDIFISFRCAEFTGSWTV